MTFLFEIFLFWIFISGNFQIFIFCLGVCGIFFVCFVVKKIFNRMNVISGIHADLTFKISFFKELKFLFSTMIEIFKSSALLMKKFACQEKIFNEIVEFDFEIGNRQICEMNFMSFAHQITSTPGSITLSQINSGKIFVHFLYKDSFDDFAQNLNKNFY